MSMGMKVWSADGSVAFDTSAHLYRVIGYGVIAFAQNEISTKTITIPGALISDRVVVQTTTAALAQIVVTRSGDAISIQRASSLFGWPTSYNIMCVR